MHTTAAGEATLHYSPRKKSFAEECLNSSQVIVHNIMSSLTPLLSLLVLRRSQLVSLFIYPAHFVNAIHLRKGPTVIGMQSLMV